MSILVEIAQKADVSVEAVVRVLTREPVSAVYKEQVMAVLETLDADQTRIVERFALAADHDVVPLEADGRDRSGLQLHGDQDAPPPESTVIDVPSVVASPATDVPLPRQQLGGGDAAIRFANLLEELIESLQELKRESRSERQEHLDDLALLIQLVTSGWEGVDRRLGRLERQVARLDGSTQGSFAAGRAEPAPPPPVAPAVADESTPEPAFEAAPARRRRVPLIVTGLLAAGVVFGALLVPELISSQSGAPHFAPATVVATEAAQRGESTADAETLPKAPTATTTSRTPARTTQGTTPGPIVPAPSAGSAPRTFVWVPVADAAYYSVRFLQAGKPVYEAWPVKPRLVVGAGALAPGKYRWVVRPGFGARSQNRLGAAIVDSSGEVEPAPKP